MRVADEAQRTLTAPDAKRRSRREGLDQAWRNVIANGADDGRLVATSFEEREGAVGVPFPSDTLSALASMSAPTRLTSGRLR